MIIVKSFNAIGNSFLVYLLVFLFSCHGLLDISKKVLKFQRFGKSFVSNYAGHLRVSFGEKKKKKN